MGDQQVVRDVDRAVAVRERQHAAVVPASKDDDLVTAGMDPCSRDRHQIRFRTRVREPHRVDRRKAIADQTRKLRLQQVMSAQIDTVIERTIDGLSDDRVRVPIETRRELRDEIDVFVTVHIPETATLTAGDGERKWTVKEYRPRIAARHDSNGPLVLQRASRIAFGVTLNRTIDRLGKRGKGRRI